MAAQAAVLHQAPVLPLAGPPREPQVPRRDALQPFEDEAARPGTPLHDLQSFATRAPPALQRAPAKKGATVSAM
eukprot:7177975-Pyramimonas_sp.AAC.1